MKKVKSIMIAVLSLALVAGLCACGNKKSDVGTKVANVMLGTNVMSLDTNLATDGDSFEVIADCIDGLTQMDAEGAAIPALAESWDVSDDGCTYIFHLRDTKWTNGDPVTANDFVFAWKLAMTANVEYNYMFEFSFN